jgi:hypothetical protein
MIEIVKANDKKRQIERTPLPDFACCGNCPFWHERTDMEATKVGEFNGGDCRLNPPNTFPVPVQTVAGVQMALNSAWPTLAADRWCGKHPERDAQTRAAVILETIDVLRDDSPDFVKILQMAGFISS